MDAEKLLPIGSVVRLRDAEKKLMVIGIQQINVERDVIKDYIGVMYPEGYFNREVFFTFNHEDIEEIYFEGYRSEEQQAFLEQIAKMKG